MLAGGAGQFLNKPLGIVKRNPCHGRPIDEDGRCAALRNRRFAEFPPAARLRRSRADQGQLPDDPLILLHQHGIHSNREGRRDLHPPLRAFDRGVIGIAGRRAQHERALRQDSHHRHVLAVMEQRTRRGHRVDEPAVDDRFARGQMPENVAKRIGLGGNQRLREIRVAGLRRLKVANPCQQLAPLAVSAIAVPSAQVNCLTQQKCHGNGAFLKQHRD